MGCEVQVSRIHRDAGAAPPLPGLQMAERGRKRSSVRVRRVEACGEPAKHYRVRGQLSETEIELCELHRHELAQTGAVTITEYNPAQPRLAGEPIGLPSAYRVPPERAR